MRKVLIELFNYFRIYSIALQNAEIRLAKKLKLPSVA